jgi:hypothetical protein
MIIKHPEVQGCKMAYQPLYATVSDNQGYTRSTSSLRGRVKSIGFWLNSLFGTVAKVSAEYTGKPKIHVGRKGKTRMEYRAAKEIAEKDAVSWERIRINIELCCNDKYDFCINGIPISNKQIKQIEQLQIDKIEQQMRQLDKIRCVL